MKQKKGIIYKLEIPTDLLEAAEYILDMEGGNNWSPKVSEYKKGYYAGIAQCAKILRPAIENKRSAGVSCAEKDDPVNDICPECGEHRPDDDRVKNGMKCRFCAYGGY